MKKKFVITSLVIMFVLFIVGIAMIFNSIDMGQRAGSRALNAHGGSMDAQQYNNIVNGTNQNYRSSGMVFSLVGGVGILISGYGVYKELE